MLSSIKINDQFRQFVNFAENSGSLAIAGQGAEISSADPSLKGRKVFAVSARTGDFVGNVGRNLGTASVDANNHVRAIFLRSVADIFGDAKDIPPSVKKALLMEDYNRGKPLSARRIIKVRDAINEEMARKAGYGTADLPKLNRATELYANYARISRQEAFEKVLDKSSPVNEVMRMGINFADAETFNQAVYLHSVEERTKLFKQIEDGMAKGEPIAGYMVVAKLVRVFDAARYDFEKAKDMDKVGASAKAGIDRIIKQCDDFVKKELLPLGTRLGSEAKAVKAQSRAQKSKELLIAARDLVAGRLYDVVKSIEGDETRICRPDDYGTSDFAKALDAITGYLKDCQKSYNDLLQKITWGK